MGRDWKGSELIKKVNGEEGEDVEGRERELEN